MSHIEWRHDGRRVTVPVLVLRPDGGDLTQVTATALVDMGANVSGIVRGIARSLNLKPAGKRPFISARGEIQVHRYLFV